MLWIKMKFEFFCLVMKDGTWEDEFCAKHNIQVSLNGVRVL